VSTGNSDDSDAPASAPGCEEEPAPGMWLTASAWIPALIQLPELNRPVRCYSVHLPPRSGVAQLMQAQDLAATIAQRGEYALAGGDWNDYGRGEDLACDAVAAQPPHLRPARMRRKYDGRFTPNYDVHDALTMIGMVDVAVHLPAEHRDPQELRPTGINGGGRADRLYVCGELAPAAWGYVQRASSSRWPGTIAARLLWETSGQPPSGASGDLDSDANICCNRVIIRILSVMTCARVAMGGTLVPLATKAEDAETSPGGTSPARTQDAVVAGGSAAGSSDRRTATRAPLVVAGFPTRNEALTIGKVVAVADQGLRDAGLSASAVLINADNGSCDGTVAAFSSCPARSQRMTVFTGSQGTGKGTNLLAIFHAALDLGAHRVVVLDGDVRSGEPWWITCLLSAVDCAGPAMAVPVYRRNRYEGNTTNHLASPLLAAALGTDVQQPIAGDFAFNRAFIERAVTWPLPESAQLYGIDIYLTGNAAREGHQIRQVRLGRKIHNPGFSKIVTISQQVIDALWHVIVLSGQVRQTACPRRLARSTVDDAAVRPDAGLIARTFARVSRYMLGNADAIAAVFPSLGGAPRAGDGLPQVPAATWAEVLADALTALAEGRGTEARDHLVALYLCRVRSYWREIEHLRWPDAIDALLDEQSALVADAVSRRSLRFTIRPPMDFRPGAWAEVT
jgi:glucosylglycerate synthase